MSLTSPLNIKDLQTFLFGHPENIKNLELLYSNYSLTDSAAFIGAGTSIPLGIKDWSKLIEDLYNECSDTFKKANVIRLKESDKFPEFADDIFKDFEAKRTPDRFNEIVKYCLEPKINSTSVTLLKISLATKIQITTNFDRSIENAYNFFTFANQKGLFKEIQHEVIYLNDLNTYLLNGKHATFYIHADLTKDIYILKKQHYDIYYPTKSKTSAGIKCIEDCLKRFLESFNIFFVGFSFSDQYVKDTIISCIKEIKKEKLIASNTWSTSNDYDKSHFILIDENSEIWKTRGVNIFSDFKDYNIYPIIYNSGHHIFIENLMDLLIEKGYPNV